MIISILNKTSSLVVLQPVPSVEEDTLPRNDFFRKIANPAPYNCIVSWLHIGERDMLNLLTLLNTQIKMINYFEAVWPPNLDRLNSTGNGRALNLETFTWKFRALEKFKQIHIELHYGWLFYKYFVWLVAGHQYPIVSISFVE